MATDMMMMWLAMAEITDRVSDTTDRSDAESPTSAVLVSTLDSHTHLYPGSSLQAPVSPGQVVCSPASDTHQ